MNIHAFRGIRTRIPSNRTAAVLSLRQHGHSDRQIMVLVQAHRFNLSYDWTAFSLHIRLTAGNVKCCTLYIQELFYKILHSLSFQMSSSLSVILARKQTSDIVQECGLFDTQITTTFLFQSFIHSNACLMWLTDTVRLCYT